MDTTDWESLFAQIAQRHSVRRYLDKPIEEEKLALLRTAAQQYNQDGGLNLRILDHDDRAFSGLLKVWFRGVRNYIVCAGPAAPDLEERCGYYGERLVLLSQRLGLNTCWAGMAKGGRLVAGTLPDGSAYVISIALGYGAEEGKAHKSKPLTELAQAMSADGGELPEPDWPQWYKAAVQSAALAPTAMNQQKFHFYLEAEGSVSAQAPAGNFTQLDLGIVKCHFELGAVHAQAPEWRWA